MICVSSDWRQRSSTVQHIEHCVYNTDNTECQSQSNAVCSVNFPQFGDHNKHLFHCERQSLDWHNTVGDAINVYVLNIFHNFSEQNEFASSPGVNSKCSCPEEGLCGRAMTEEEDDVEEVQNADGEEEERSVKLCLAGGGGGGGG